MNYKELILIAKSDVEEASALEQKAWEALTNEGTVDSIRYRAMFVVQYATGIKNAALKFIDQLEQIEAQSKMSAGPSIRM